MYRFSAKRHEGSLRFHYCKYNHALGNVFSGCRWFIGVEQEKENSNWSEDCKKRCRQQKKNGKGDVKIERKKKTRLEKQNKGKFNRLVK